MRFLHDQQFLWTLEGIGLLLLFSTGVGQILARTVRSEQGLAVVANLNQRIRSWWIMSAVLIMAMATGGLGSVLLFGATSFLALREFITITPTNPSDHRTLFWAFFVFTPFQYWLVSIHWYGMFAIFIPVYAGLFVPLRGALAGDTRDFLARTAKIQWGLMLCVYCVSYAPALLMLDIPGFERQNIKLLMFLVIVVQLSDVMQYVFGKLLGRHKIAPLVSPSKTWEGFVGGILAATAVGAGLWWSTPFKPWQAALIALLISLAGFAGGLCMSAIKRDRGIKDFGAMIEGHGGVLDRIDSICFAAPLFFHVTRYFFT